MMIGGDALMVMRSWRVAELLRGVASLDDLERVIECVGRRGWFVEVYRIVGDDERYYDFYRANRPYRPAFTVIVPLGGGEARVVWWGHGVIRRFPVPPAEEVVEA